ncbi:hypothetical protein GGF46_003339 [Coemansia sp. RSA 552]|nr:hypothetical protein GGF46_003339 [Coemansia sp. RSA 552]
MAVIELQFKASLEGLTDLAPNEAAGPEEGAAPYLWHFKVQCGSCREVSENLVTIARTDSSKISGSRGEANLVMRCKGCKREGSMSIMDEQPRAFTDQDKGFVTMLALDCRGMEPVEFDPCGEWKARGSESGTVFDDVNLDEGEWFGYDEEAGEAVSVSDIKTQFVAAKKARGKGKTK